MPTRDWPPFARNPDLLWQLYRLAKAASTDPATVAGYPPDKGFDPFRLGLLQACEAEHQRRVGRDLTANEKHTQAVYVLNP
jgi:hypothetical protein